MKKISVNRVIHGHSGISMRATINAVYACGDRIKSYVEVIRDDGEKIKISKLSIGDRSKIHKIAKETLREMDILNSNKTIGEL